MIKLDINQIWKGLLHNEKNQAGFQWSKKGMGLFGGWCKGMWCRNSQSNLYTWGSWVMHHWGSSGVCGMHADNNDCDCYAAGRDEPRGMEKPPKGSLCNFRRLVVHGDCLGDIYSICSAWSWTWKSLIIWRIVVRTSFGNC